MPRTAGKRRSRGRWAEHAHHSDELMFRPTLPPFNKTKAKIVTHNLTIHPNNLYASVIIYIPHPPDATFMNGRRLRQSSRCSARGAATRAGIQTAGRSHHQSCYLVGDSAGADVLLAGGVSRVKDDAPQVLPKEARPGGSTLWTSGHFILSGRSSLMVLT